MLIAVATPAEAREGSGAVEPEAAAGKALPEVPVTAMDLGASPAHNSPGLAVHPADRRFLALASRLDAPDFGCALHVSGDGGRGWLPANPLPRLPEGAEKCYAPEVAFDPAGRLYYLFLGLRGAGNTPMGAFLTTSDDRGRTFSPPGLVLGPQRYMVRMALDPDIGRRGRLHLVWLEARSDPPTGGLPSGLNPIMAAYSDDGGTTFSTPVQVSDADRPLAVAPAVAVGGGHAVHVLYFDLGDDARDYQGLEGPVWEGSWNLVAATSTDGGRSFGRGTLVDDGVLPFERVMLIYTMPAPAFAADRSGRLYAAWPDGRHGDADVLTRVSPDGGRTWRDARRLNDDVGVRRVQYLPRLAVAPDGRVDAVFYDRRRDPENAYNDVMFTSSSDHGQTWTPNLRLTSDSSDSRSGQRYLVPSAKDLVEFGSRLGLASLPTGPVVAWTDTRNTADTLRAQEIFATSVEVDPDGGGGLPAAAVPVAGALLVGLIAAVGLRRLRRRDHPTSSPGTPPGVGR